LRKWYDFSPLVAVAAGGRNSAHPVFRRCTAPEKIRIDRTDGNNSGELKAGKKGRKNAKKDEKTQKKWKKGEKAKK